MEFNYHKTPDSEHMYATRLEKYGRVTDRSFAAAVSENNRPGDDDRLAVCPIGLVSAVSVAIRSKNTGSDAHRDSRRRRFYLR